VSLRTATTLQAVSHAPVRADSREMESTAQVIKHHLQCLASKAKSTTFFGRPYVVMGRPLCFTPVVSSFCFFSWPILSGRRLDVCNTSRHDVAFLSYDGCLEDKSEDCKNYSEPYGVLQQCKVKCAC